SRTLATRTYDATPEDVDRVRRTAHVIERNATAQLRIVEDLLDVQRIVAGRLVTEYSSCDLRQIAQGVIDSLLPAAVAKRLRIHADLEPIEIDCDGSRIQQVLWNLLGSAVKFTPEGGRIDFVIRRDGRQTIVRIRDSGEGIPHEF